MLRSYELQKVNEPNPKAVSESAPIGLSNDLVKGGRLIVGLQLGLVGMLGTVDAIAIPGILETVVTAGRGRKIGNFFNKTLNGIDGFLDKLNESTFYNAYANKNIAKGLIRGFVGGQTDTAVSAIYGAEAGGIVGAIIGSHFSGAAEGAIIGAKIGAGICGAIAEFGVIGGAFDRIRAGFGAEGPLDRLGMRRVQKAKIQAISATA